MFFTKHHKKVGHKNVTSAKLRKERSSRATKALRTWSSTNLKRAGQRLLLGFLLGSPHLLGPPGATIQRAGTRFRQHEPSRPVENKSITKVVLSGWEKWHEIVWDAGSSKAKST